MCQSIDLILRILIGALLGGAIGLERELRSKGAGFRTHFLVALGSSLLTVISIYGYEAVIQSFPDVRFDPSRITAQIVSGIGFIGAGIIIFQKNAVHGLTTAAGLWVTSALGIACGTGRYDLACAATILVLIALEITYFINIRQRRRQMDVKVSSKDRKVIEKFIETLVSEGVKIRSCEMQVLASEGEETYTAVLEIGVREAGYEERVWDLMEGMEGSVVMNIM